MFGTNEHAEGCVFNGIVCLCFHTAYVDKIEALNFCQFLLF